MKGVACTPCERLPSTSPHRTHLSQALDAEKKQPGHSYDVAFLLCTLHLLLVEQAPHQVLMAEDRHKGPKMAERVENGPKEASL